MSEAKKVSDLQPANDSKLKIIYIGKEKLRKLEANPRRDKDKKGIEKLRVLIREHGFQNPLQVYEETGGVFLILCGNHRFEAGLQEGMEEFPCLIYGGDRSKAIARAVSDNKSNEWTEFDIPPLKDILCGLDTGDFNMELTGFTEEETKEMFDFASPEKEPGTGGGEGPCVCGSCGNKH